MSKFSSIASFAKDHAAVIETVAGIALFTVTAVCAAKTRTKVEEIRVEYEENVKLVKDVLADENIPESKYSEEDAENDIRIFKAKAIVKGVTVSIPTAGLVGAGFVGARISNNLYIPLFGMMGAAVGNTIGSYKVSNMTKKEKVQDIGRMAILGSVIIPISTLVAMFISAGSITAFRKVKEVSTS